MGRASIKDEGVKFSSENQPANRGRKKGVPNRATVYKRLLKMKVDVKDPETGDKIQVTLYEAMALGQIQSAMKGNTRAWQEIQDSLHGKLTDKTEHSGEIRVKTAEDLTDDELAAHIPD
jgi:hypothetical protein